MTDDPPGWALALLAEARVGRLATADAGGQPLVVPVCYAVEPAGGRPLYTAVDAKPKRTRQLRRLSNVAENPRISLVVDHYEEDWRRLRWVIVEGRAEVLVAGPERRRGLDLLVAKYEQYRTMGLAGGDDAVVKIVPTRYVCWSAA